MTFAASKLAAISRQYAIDGVSAVHMSIASGAKTTVTVLLDTSGGQERHGSDAFGQIASIRVRASEVAVVAGQDTFTIDSDVYEVGGARMLSSGLQWESNVSKR